MGIWRLTIGTDIVPHGIVFVKNMKPVSWMVEKRGYGDASSFSAAGDGLTNIMENHTFVPRAHYLRLLRRRRRYEPQHYSVLRLCSEFRDSRSFLCLNIKKVSTAKVHA